jgi:hypothetical protein
VTAHGKLTHPQPRPRMRSVNPAKPWKCELCYKSFATDDRLQVRISLAIWFALLKYYWGNEMKKDEMHGSWTTHEGRWEIYTKLCKIWGFHGGDYEKCRLLVCGAVEILCEPMFWRNILPATFSCWFLARRFFYPEVGSHKIYMASRPRRWHFSIQNCLENEKQIDHMGDLNVYVSMWLHSSSSGCSPVVGLC